MSYYSNALSDEELASLRDYLDEVREKTIYDNMDVQEMDGFLTAAAINPQKLNISQLTPYIFDITGNRESLSRADDRILYLIHRRYIEIKEHLENKTDLEPIIFHHVDENDQPLKGEDSLVAAFGWAHGFMFGFCQWPREIQEFPATQISFIPIFSCLAMYENASDLYSEELLNESRLAREMLPPINDLNDIIEYIMRATHLLYKATYQAYSENEALIRRKAYRIGRNDPCPCGSGKKYKHCCGKRA